MPLNDLSKFGGGNLLSAWKDKFNGLFGSNSQPKGIFWIKGSTDSVPVDSQPLPAIKLGAPHWLAPAPPPIHQPLNAQANAAVNLAPTATQLLRLICLVAHKDEDLTAAGATFGCAFAIGGGWFMTAHHVLPDLESLRHHRAIFYPENGECETATPTYELTSYFASADGIRSENGFDYTLDYAVFHLASRAQDGAWVCSAAPCAKGDVVDILRPVRKTPDGQAPVIGFGVVRTVSTNGKSGPFDRITAVDELPIFFHECSSWGGDSGSPIVNANWQVVGLHTHGFQKGFEGNKATFNWGSHIAAVANDLKTRNSDIYDQCFALHAAVDAKQAHPVANLELFVQGTL